MPSLRAAGGFPRRSRAYGKQRLAGQRDAREREARREAGGLGGDLHGGRRRVDDADLEGAVTEFAYLCPGGETLHGRAQMVGTGVDGFAVDDRSRQVVDLYAEAGLPGTPGVALGVTV